MRQNFDKSLELVLVHEGGYVDHPKDPGGATNLGITQRTLSAHLGRPVTKMEVRNMTRETAAEIYRKEYWDRARCDDLPSGVDYMVFDGAVNSGVSRSAKWLQKAVGVTEDGVIGAHTLYAVNNYPHSISHLIESVCNERMRFLKRLKHWPTFKRGWTRRVMGKTTGAQDYDTGVIDRAVRMSRNAPVRQPLTLDDGAGAKAVGTPKGSWFVELILSIFGGQND